MNVQIQSLLGRLAGLSAAVGVGSFVLSESLYNVDGGQVAVVWHRFNGGVQQYVVGEGTHFREFFWTRACWQAYWARVLVWQSALHWTGYSATPSPDTLASVVVLPRALSHPPHSLFAFPHPHCCQASPW